MIYIKSNKNNHLYFYDNCFTASAGTMIGRILFFFSLNLKFNYLIVKRFITVAGTI